MQLAAQDLLTMMMTPFGWNTDLDHHQVRNQPNQTRFSKSRYRQECHSKVSCGENTAHCPRIQRVSLKRVTHESPLKISLFLHELWLPSGVVIGRWLFPRPNPAFLAFPIVQVTLNLLVFVQKVQPKDCRLRKKSPQHCRKGQTMPGEHGGGGGIL